MKGLFFINKIIPLILIAFLVTFISDSGASIEIPSSSIRMRVIAKSNSQNDQNDKMIIKTALEDYLYDLTKDVKSSKEADMVIEEHLDELDDHISNTIKKEKINTTFKSSYGYNYFPEKEFKGVKYKSGNYKSYVVTLDEGKGDNWWCVLYPPLCLIDEDVEDNEYHFLIKDTLEKYN